MVLKWEVGRRGLWCVRVIVLQFVLMEYENLSKLIVMHCALAEIQCKFYLIINRMCNRSSQQLMIIRQKLEHCMIINLL